MQTGLVLNFDASTKVLLAMRKQIEDRKSKVKVIDAEGVEIYPKEGEVEGRGPLFGSGEARSIDSIPEIGSIFYFSDREALVKISADPVS